MNPINDLDQQLMNEETTKLKYITPAIQKKWDSESDQIVMEYGKKGSGHYFTDGQILVEPDGTLNVENEKKSTIFCCLRIVAKTIKRGKSPTYTTKSSDVLVFAQKCNVKNGGIDLSLCQLLDESVLSKYSEEEFMLDKDIVINSTGTGTLGRVGIYRNTDNTNGKRLVPDSHVTIVRLVDKVYSPYVYYIICNYQKYLESKGSGSTKQKELKPDVIKSLLIPIPPYEEQCRIVEKLDQVLPRSESNDIGF